MLQLLSLLFYLSYIYTYASLACAAVVVVVVDVKLFGFMCKTALGFVSLKKKR